MILLCLDLDLMLHWVPQKHTKKKQIAFQESIKKSG